MVVNIIKFIIYCVLAWLLANAVYTTIIYFDTDADLGMWGYGVFFSWIISFICNL